MKLRKISKNPYGELNVLYLSILANFETNDMEVFLSIPSAVLVCIDDTILSTHPEAVL